MNVSDLEAAVVRDSIWSGVQQFKLPNEAALLDELYAEFGDEPMAILLPKDRPGQPNAPPKTAPLFDRGRSILRDIIAGFLTSDDWRSWVHSRGTEDGAGGAGFASGATGGEGSAGAGGGMGMAAHAAIDSAHPETGIGDGKAVEKTTAVAADGASRADGEGDKGACGSGDSSSDASSWDGWD